MRTIKTALAGIMVCTLGWGSPGLAEQAPAAASPTTAPATTSAAPAAPAGPLTAADFAALPFAEGVRLSPNGEWVAGLFGQGEERRVCAISLFDTKAKRSCIGVPDRMEAHSIRWINDDSFIVHITAQVSVQGSLWYVSRLASFNRTTGKLKMLMWDLAGQNADDVIWTARDGSPYALVGAQESIYTGDEFWPSIFRVNVDTGAREKVLKGRDGVMGWVADGNGLVRLGYGYNDERRSSRLYYRGESGGQFRTIDRADQRRRESTITPMGFIPGGNHALVVHADDKGNSTLFESDLDPIKDVKPLYTAPEGSWIDDVTLAADGQTPLAVSLRGRLQKDVWIDTELAGLQANFDKAVGSRRARIASFSRDRKRMLVLVDLPESPGALYFYDTDVGTMQRIALMNDHLGSRALSPVRMVTYRARDNLEIEAVVTTPKGKEGRKLPVIVMPHGGPWSHDTLDYDYWAQFLANKGYLVIQPNFRGSTGYGESFERRGEGQLGLAMQDDLNDALDWAVKQGLADGKRACIMGASYGGYAAMWGAARDPDLWRCAISIAGVASLRREVNDMGDHALNENSNRDAWTRMTPDFPAVSPINAVDRIKAPMLLIHGKKDVRVDIGQSNAMAAKMRAAGKNVELVQIPLADHYFTRAPDRLTLLTSVETFLAKYNPAD
ncbi:alpha/beta hydrolase family protein [Novosphingobium terrae]|uniref:alpha/beta hydrolase family protein n=1 Tax=Novosphingobium terrae TaxID=2726189 RepID=UPI00197FD2D3|nr:S9 family peptidase [Novosphingobium terrae]